LNKCLKLLKARLNSIYQGNQSDYPNAYCQ
jgi:hypothetical protein